MRIRPLPVIAALIPLLSSCGGSEPRPRNLLLVTLDTLRADRLGSYGYAAALTPNLDRLAGRGLRFRRAVTVTPLTLPAHASLMTGTHPGSHGVRDNGGFYLEEEAETLAELLRAAGFRTGGFVGAFVLDSRWGIGQGFDRFFDDFDLTEFDDAPSMDAIQRPGSEVVDRALDWLPEPAETPFFAWVHLYDPHTPYQAPERFRSRFPATRDGDSRPWRRRAGWTRPWWWSSPTTARCWASTTRSPTASSSTTPRSRSRCSSPGRGCRRR
jgi:arylsulfatase A-like enzyme